jgi:hypothetical protein
MIVVALVVITKTTKFKIKGFTNLYSHNYISILCDHHLLAKLVSALIELNVEFWPGVSCSACCNCRRFWGAGWRMRTRLSNWSQRWSMGFKSGGLDGQGSTVLCVVWSRRADKTSLCVYRKEMRLEDLVAIPLRR